jgi:hypothetical protein
MDRTDEDRAVPAFEWLPWMTDRLIERVRARSTPVQIAQMRTIDDAEAVFPDEGGEFVGYFIGGEGGPLATIPFDVTDAIHMEMMEAKRVAGWSALTDYCLRLLPVVDAIGRYSA